MLEQLQYTSSTSITDLDVEEGGLQEVLSREQSLDETAPLPGSQVHKQYEEDSASLRSFNLLTHRRLAIFVLIFLVVVGAVSSGCFLALGITSSREDQNDQFVRRSSELVKEIQNAFKDYEVAGQWVQEAGRKEIISREDFHALYLNLISTGLEFQVASFNPNTTATERAELEQEASEFYTQNYPDIDYQGVVGVEPNTDGEGVSVQPRSEQPFYFPVHLLEPVEGNEGAIDFDLYSSASRRKTIHKAIETWKPALTPRLRLVQETDPSAYSVILMHPGIPLPGLGDKPESFSSMVIRIPDLLKRASQGQAESTTVYIFDTSNPVVTQQFLGGARVYGETKMRSLPEVDFETAQQHGRKYVEVINIVGTSEWTLVVVDRDGAYDPENGFVILAGTLLFLLCLALAIFVYCTMERMTKLNRLKADAQQEKSMLVVENARHSAQTERELNDFIAHEVRNPLSAAMSACSFVASAVEDESNPSLVRAQTRNSVVEDIGIIDSSLHFINDLLRNMLDMHRARSNQLKIDMAPTHLLHDVFQPVTSMLHLRGSNFRVLVDCPSDLVVLTDSLRLKQIVLNLARNAMKFVNQGFIRLRATVVVDGNVRLCIEDSGPGIPPEKREMIFGRFQESLDSLNQGTGIGLSLCKNLTELMKGEIWIDETYDSGVAGCPGTRFIMDLHSPPLQLDDWELDKYGLLLVDEESGTRGPVATVTAFNSVEQESQSPKQELPEGLSVLFVDDDLVLRKMFCRSIKKAAPTWKMQEAANGETALKRVDTETFDLIFMDQYMASVQKQLLGTETTRALRAKGVTAKICGLSANDVEELFIEAGADCFLIKPFPCQKEALQQELARVVFSKNEHVHF
jgi:signal transduction histidine kinase/CheY-like chemotaxis protein